MCVGGMRMSTTATSGLCIATCRSRSSGRAGLRDDLEARLLEQARDALAEQHRVVGQHDAASVAELRDGAAQRREVAWQVVGEHLVDALGVGQALQPMRAEVARVDLGDERRGRRREQDLAAVAGRRDA